MQKSKESTVVPHQRFADQIINVLEGALVRKRREVAELVAKQKAKTDDLVEVGVGGSRAKSEIPRSGVEIAEPPTPVAQGSPGAKDTDVQSTPTCDPEVRALFDLREATNFSDWRDSRVHTEGWKTGWHALTITTTLADAMQLQLMGVQFGRDGHVMKVDLNSCGLSGELPDSLGDLLFVESMWLHANNLTGRIPSVLGMLPKLDELRLFNNQLCGPLPLSLGVLKTRAFEVVVDSGMELSDDISDVKSAVEIDFGGFGLSGCIPSTLGELFQLEILKLHENELHGTVPELLAQLPRLRELSLEDNQLTGALPTHWSKSLRALQVQDNPDLWGTMTKEIILQCNTINYSGCKPRSQKVDGKWTKNEQWMQGPFVVGASFASEDIGHLLAQRGAFAISAGMLRDAPRAGSPGHSMLATHGPRWCAWQEVWLDGLRGLRDRRVYVLSGKGVFANAPRHFRPKFEAVARYATRVLCDQDSFDPYYMLGDPEEGLEEGQGDRGQGLRGRIRAVSILDWERRHLERVARTNNLEIVHVDSFEHARVSTAAPDWYSDPRPSSIAGMEHWDPAPAVTPAAAAPASAGVDAAGIGPLPADLAAYQPARDRSHQRLGISFAGMLMFLEAAGFLRWRGKHALAAAPEKSYEKALGWQYECDPPYVRDGKTASWLDGVVGPVEVCAKHGLKHLTGYDVCAFLRRWLAANNYEQLSVCEVILTQARFRSLRPHVRPATVFWSHIQLEGFLGIDGTLDGIAFARGPASSARLPERAGQFYWLDYFCLRQCQRDFAAEVVVPLVREVGTLVACMKFDVNERLRGPAFKGANYLQRSFCVLELYAAIAGGATLVCNTGGYWKELVEAILAEQAPPSDDGMAGYWLGPVDCTAAMSRSAEDKAQIDKFIDEAIGACEMNRVVTGAIFDGITASS